MLTEDDLPMEQPTQDPVEEVDVIGDEHDLRPKPEPPPVIAQTSPDPRHRPNFLRHNVRRNQQVYNDSYVFNVSITEGMRKHGLAAEDSIRAELGQMVAKEIWEPFHHRQVPHYRPV